MTNRRDVTLFLSAEGVEEQEDATWLRAATDEEISALKAERAGELCTTSDASEHDWKSLFIDEVGLMYFLMTVTGDAPLDIWNYASSHLRLRRIEP